MDVNVCFVNEQAVATDNAVWLVFAAHPKGFSELCASVDVIVNMVVICVRRFGKRIILIIANPVLSVPAIGWVSQKREDDVINVMNHHIKCDLSIMQVHGDLLWFQTFHV